MKFTIVMSIMPLVVLAQYTRQIAQLAANYAGLSYCSNDSIQNHTCGKLCDSIIASKIHYIDDDEYDTAAVIIENNDSVVVSFRGTSNIQNDILDIEIKKTRYKQNNATYGNVHRGFLNAYSKLYPKLFDTLKIIIGHQQINNSNFQALITGHSLGVVLLICLYQILFSNFH